MVTDLDTFTAGHRNTPHNLAGLSVTVTQHLRQTNSRDACILKGFPKSVWVVYPVLMGDIVVPPLRTEIVCKCRTDAVVAAEDLGLRELDWVWVFDSQVAVPLTRAPAWSVKAAITFPSARAAYS
jgi:hypothetical protein